MISIYSQPSYKDALYLNFNNSSIIWRTCNSTTTVFRWRLICAHSPKPSYLSYSANHCPWSPSADRNLKAFSATAVPNICRELQQVRSRSKCDSSPTRHFRRQSIWMLVICQVKCRIPYAGWLSQIPSPSSRSLRIGSAYLIFSNKCPQYSKTIYIWQAASTWRAILPFQNWIQICKVHISNLWTLLQCGHIRNW
jgi:hypothetical protein